LVGRKAAATGASTTRREGRFMRYLEPAADVQDQVDLVAPPSITRRPVREKLAARDAAGTSRRAKGRSLMSTVHVSPRAAALLTSARNPSIVRQDHEAWQREKVFILSGDFYVVLPRSGAKYRRIQRHF
jgi:hypothetical protein